MAEKRHIFLIPGFFGFASIGEVLYFAHIVEFLSAACYRLGLRVEIHRVPTHPTASIRKRAAALAEAIARTGAASGGGIDLIGHSTGGLDARLLATPRVSLPTEVAVEPLASRIRSVVTVAAPHHGTPLSSVFGTLFGKPLLRLLSLATLYVLRFGHLPTSVVLRMSALIVRLDSRLGLTHNVADQLFNELLGDFSPERRLEVQRFLEQASLDQALMAQVTPEGADVFNAGTVDREGVRYGSVVTMAPRPGLRSVWRQRLDPYAHLTHAIFFMLYRASAGGSGHALPALTPAQRELLPRAFGRLPQSSDNDGVVPTGSQLWGEVIHAAVADHLDVIGHFGDARRVPPHYDWLASGSGFRREHFERLWTDVAYFLADRARPVLA